jgi:hypothetical protein
VIAAFMNLILFTMFQFFVFLGVTVFLIAFYIKRHPESAMYWAGVVRRILEL